MYCDDDMSVTIVIGVLLTKLTSPNIGNKNMKLFQKEIDVSKTASGHFSLDIEPQRKKKQDTQLDIKCLVSDTKEELTEKELKKNKILLEGCLKLLIVKK